MQSTNMVKVSSSHKCFMPGYTFISYTYLYNLYGYFYTCLTIIPVHDIASVVYFCTTFIYFYLFVYSVCVYTMWRAIDQLCESGLSYHVSPGSTHFTKFGSEPVYQMSLLASPLCFVLLIFYTRLQNLYLINI